MRPANRRARTGQAELPARRLELEEQAAPQARLGQAEAEAVQVELEELARRETQLAVRALVLAHEVGAEEGRVVRAEGDGHAGRDHAPQRMVGHTRDDPEALVGGEGHVAADLPLRQEPQDRLVVHGAHTVLHPAHPEVLHRLAHVFGVPGLPGVGHRTVARLPRAVVERAHVPARESLLRPAEADGDHDRVGLRLRAARPCRGRCGPWTRSGCR